MKDYIGLEITYILNQISKKDYQYINDKEWFDKNQNRDYLLREISVDEECDFFIDIDLSNSIPEPVPVPVLVPKMLIKRLKRGRFYVKIFRCSDTNSYINEIIKNNSGDNRPENLIDTFLSLVYEEVCGIQSMSNDDISYLSNIKIKEFEDYIAIPSEEC